MPTLEDQIARLAEAAFERTEPVAFDPLVRRTATRRWASPVGLAAAVLLIAALAGLLAMVWFRDADDTPAPAATFPPRPAVNEPTVTYPVDEEWLVPTELPAGMQLEIAQRPPITGIRFLSYIDPTNAARVSVTVGQDIGAIEPTRDVELGGRLWRSLTDDAAGWVSYTATVDGVPVEVTVSGLSEGDADRIVASLAWQQASSLPRPPLDLGAGSVLVATAEQEGAPTELRVDTDGVTYSYRITTFVDGGSGGGGGSMGLHPGEVLSLGDASGPRTDLVIGGRESESLIYGLARADVVTVVAELTDGRTVSAPVQDLSGRFVENFYIVAVPTRTEGGFELLDEIVALDADGNELFRGPGPF